jgi:hypothetical protein
VLRGALVTAFRSAFASVPPQGSQESAVERILLQKSFEDDERNFLGPLMRFVRKDVRDLIAHQKNGDGASYRRHGVL